MAEIIASISKGSKQLKELQTPIIGDNISVLTSALKKAKDSTNKYLTVLVTEQMDSSNSSKELQTPAIGDKTSAPKEAKDSTKERHVVEITVTSPMDPSDYKELAGYYEDLDESTKKKKR